ncbi:MAG TPA: SRPBCC family protein [Acidimicrobiales bacterium]|nr:SRPBCC family protein [Acidimicrobiales bacterium]
MKYADGPTVEVEVLIDAPAERVWALVSDIDLPARFSSEFLGSRWIDGAIGPAPGARFVGRNRHPVGGEWETTCVVDVYEPGRSFGWAVGDPDYPSASWCFDIEPEQDGVRLRQWARLGPAPSGLTPAIEAMPDKEERIVARRLDEHRANMQATVEGVKALAEDEGR